MRLRSRRWPCTALHAPLQGARASFSFLCKGSHLDGSFIVVALYWVGHSNSLLCRHALRSRKTCNVRHFPLFFSTFNADKTNGTHLYSAVVLFWTQILNGLGGGISVVCVKLMVQASVPHEDMGIVISNLALWTKLFGAISTAVGE